MKRFRVFRAPLHAAIRRWSRNVRDTNGVSSSVETGSSIDK
ncbi:hypothetical protein ABLN73_19150 [Mycobacterium tuberculosis]